MLALRLHLAGHVPWPESLGLGSLRSSTHARASATVLSQP